MAAPISDFYYHLPGEFIAQTPANPRESAKLMVLDRSVKTIQHKRVADLPTYFRKGDVVVINNTKVFHARLHGTTNGHRVELFLVRPIASNQWLALGKPGKKMHIGNTIRFADDFSAIIQEKRADGTLVVGFSQKPHDVIAKANIYGTVPVPPYIKTIPNDRDYQTSYAKIEGSVAAPTAGFHLTKHIRNQLLGLGVQILEITLHVGLGTFLPVKTQTIEDHTMHSEWASVSAQVAAAITKAKLHRQRIVAIGTTTVRTLEGIATLHNGKLETFEGDINLFIKPGFQFQIVDAMLTNFHLPKSTLIILVSAFGGRKFIRKAYNEAISNNYRFYSFGDAMLIV